MTKLLIVESPTKERTLSKFLGKDFKVISTVGHFRDLPKSKLGVDIENGFEPDYQIIEGKEKVIKEIKSQAAKADAIYLAPDPDREGEAIAWHVASVLGGIRHAPKSIYRVEFHEITKNAVTSAIKHPREIDLQLVDAQQARRVLDRLVGYKISPILWKKVRTGLSAGRVQSVAVRLICERELEIRSFKPEEYWSILALLETARGERFWAKLAKIDGKEFRIPDETAAKAIEGELSGKQLDVTSVSEKEFTRKAPPPFITSTLQQEANRKFGWSGKRTMQIAQQLYEGVDLDGTTEGLITYMRTDSVRISEEGISQARAEIKARFGGEFLPASANVFKGKGQIQDAHEAIRPTAASHHPEDDVIKRSLKPDQLKLYNLIWLRFVASQMAAAKFSTRTVDCESGKYLFRTSDTRTLFPGFLALYDPRASELRKEEDAGEDEGVPILPLPREISKGDKLAVSEFKRAQHFTKPLPRYNDASLVKALEEFGIGRPSTYSTIIDTIIQRQYVTREKRSFVPTEWGFLVTDLMKEYFSEIVDVGFTAGMEEKLDGVAEGKEGWKDLVSSFWKVLEEDLASAEKDPRKFRPEPVLTEHDCEVCGAKMLIRQSRFGKFLGCSRFPECKHTKPLDKNGDPAEGRTNGAVPLGEKCPECAGELLVRINKWGGQFVACSGFPKCKYSRELQTVCPKCGGSLEKRAMPNKRKVYVCTDEKNCGFKLFGTPLLDRCDKCGYFLAERKDKLSGDKVVFCSNVECENNGGILT